MKKNKFPVLLCYPTDTGQVKAWCPYCEKWHIHGFTDKIKRAVKIGHWMPHCENKDSHFRETNGYELRLMSKADIRAIADSIKHYPN